MPAATVRGTLMQGSFVLLPLLLLLLVALSRCDSVGFGDVRDFDGCSNQALVDLQCGNTTLVGGLTILGVSRKAKPTQTSFPSCTGSTSVTNTLNVAGVTNVYQVSVRLTYPVYLATTCTASFVWRVVPVASQNRLCNAIDCPEATQCGYIDPFNVTVAVDPPVYRRTLEPQYTFPHSYVALTKFKAPMLVANTSGFDQTEPSPEQYRVFQASQILENDDNDEKNAYQCITSTQWDGGIRTRGCCPANPSSKSDLRNYDCTQDFNQCQCHTRRETENDDGCVTYYCNTPSTNNYETYLASTSSCWVAQTGSTPTNFSSGEYVPQTNAPDSSASCCTGCTSDTQACPNTIGLSPNGVRCNKAINRFIFPQLSPASLIDNYFSTDGTTKPVPMSNNLANGIGTDMTMDNTTYVFQGALSGFLDKSGVATYRLYTRGTDVDQRRSDGVYMPLPKSRSLDLSPVVRSVSCSYCGQGGNFWNKVCPSGIGVYATKNYVLGMTPRYQMHKPVQPTLVGSFRMTMVPLDGTSGPTRLVSFNDFPYSATGQLCNNATANSGFLGALQSPGLTLLSDPYTTITAAYSSDGTGKAFGSVAIGEPQLGLAQSRFAAFNSTNPWVSLSNPVAQLGGGRSGCAYCLPYQQTVLAGGKQGATPWFFVTNQNQFSFVNYGSYDASPENRCTANGFGDIAFAYDDCDQVQLNYPLGTTDGGDSTREQNSPGDYVTPGDQYFYGDLYQVSKQRLYNFMLPNAQISQDCREIANQASCPCGRSDNADLIATQRAIAGRLQSLLCMMDGSNPNSFCRPTYTGASIASSFAQFLNFSTAPGANIADLYAKYVAPHLSTLWNPLAPNIWLARKPDAASGLVMYYLPVNESNPGARNSVSLSTIVIDSQLNIVTTPPTLIVVNATLCSCTDPGTTQLGSIGMYYSPVNGQQTQSMLNSGYQYLFTMVNQQSSSSPTCKLCITGSKDCSASNITVSVRDVRFATLLYFQCTYPDSYGSAQRNDNTIRSSVQYSPAGILSYGVSAQAIVLPSCPAMCSAETGCTVRFTKSVSSSSLYGNGGAQCKNNPSSPPASPPAPPNEAPVSPGTPVMDNSTSVPIRAPNVTLQPTAAPLDPNANKSTDNQNEPDDGSNILYYVIPASIVGGIILLIVVVLIGYGIYKCTHKPPPKPVSKHKVE